MNEVGGSESGTGLRAIKSSHKGSCRRVEPDANFEYDDSEWDVGIGNLIIDLDADIEKNNEANRNNNNSSSNSNLTSVATGSLSSGSSATSGSSSSSSSSSNPQMHIPLTSSSTGNSSNSSSNSGGTASGGSSKKSSGGGNGNSSLSKGSGNNSSSTSSSADLSSVMEHSSVVDKGLKMKIKRTKTGTKSGADAKHEIVKNDVLGSSSNGTSSGGGSSGSGYSSHNSKSISDALSSKNSHSSHKDKDKLFIKDGLLHDNSHDGSINNATSANAKQADNSGDHHGGKVKTPRKGSAKEKKVKNSGGSVGNSGNSKKDEKNSDSKSLANSNSGSNSATTSSSGSSGTHAKDNKEFFSTTVNLNVPNVIPNSSSSAFVKTTATIKVPTAPSSAVSGLSSSSSGSVLHNVHSSGDSTPLPGSNSRSSSNSSANSNNTPWGTVSPVKGADRGRLSPSVANLSNSSTDKTGSSYNKKARAFAVTDKSGGSIQDENSSGSHGGSSSTSYRNQGGLCINSTPTDLSTTSSSSFVSDMPASQSAGNGFGSSKETGKGSRNSVAASTTTSQDVCVGTSVGTITEPDCLGPCEPGTSVTLEGIVWHETQSGVLVVNVTWRGKTYVGTLIDCTKNDWAPPRFCDSPTSDLEMRTPKNRGKRGRAQTATPVNDPVVAETRPANAKLRNGAKGRRGSNTPAAAAFVAPASPVKPDPWPKRKTRGSENESQEDCNPKSAKRPKVSKDGDRKERRSNSPAGEHERGPSSPQVIECPEPNCFKKYTHMNGLRYHLSHAHANNVVVAAEDSDSNLSTASNTNTSAPAEQATSADTVEPMVVDNSPEPAENATGIGSTPNSVPEDSLSAPPTPGKKSSTTPPATAKVDDKVYDLSSDSDLNPIKDLSVQPPQEHAENFSNNKSLKGSGKSQTANKEGSGVSSDLDSKPENLSKDSVSASTSSSTSTTTSTPTITPRTPILTVPVVPYMSLQSRNLVHGHVVNVPRVDCLNNSRDSDNGSFKASGSQHAPPTSKSAPWQPHAHSQSQQSGLSSHGSSHVMNTSPPQQQSSITVPLNIPMNIPEKLGGGSKDKDRNSMDQSSSKKNKHKKKSKDKDKERDGKGKSGEKERRDSSSGKNLSGLSLSGVSDYSRSSGMFHNSASGGDARAKDLSSEGDTDSSRKNSIENRDDPQSPAYSDISDANDSGPDNELNVGSAIKDNCKGLVIPGEMKKDSLGVQGVPAGGPPLSFFNHHGFYSPYLDTPTNPPGGNPASAPSGRQAKDVAGPGIEDDNGRSGAKHPPPPSQQPLPPSAVGDEARRSPKMDFHPKYPFSNPYFPAYPYSGYHYDHPPFGNPGMVPENSFSGPGAGRMFPGMEDREKEGGPGGIGDQRLGNQSKNGKSADKEDTGPGGIQIKQEPLDRDEIRRGSKDHRSQSSAMTSGSGEDKHVEIKSEFGADHPEPKLLPPFMSNSSNKHSSSKDHKRDDRHERRHESSKDSDAKSDKPGRNSMGSSEKNSSKVEEPEAKERKDEGAKPTMETTGPPPPPTASAYYLPQSYLPGNPFLPFDPSHPLYRQVLVPGPYPASPYMHPGSLPRFPSPGGPTPLPEDLSRPSPSGPGNPSKALDLLQHHAAQYYSAHKIHELQERALKSPSPQVVASQRDRENSAPGPGSNLPPTPSSPGGHPLGGPLGVSHPGGGGRSSVGSSSGSGGMPKPADLSKEAKPVIGPGGSIIPGGPNSDNGRTPPPTQHHVHSHTHHHTHVGIGYPIIPTVPPQYSPHYGSNAKDSNYPFTRS